MNKIPTEPQIQELQQIRLEQARLEWASTKTQMAVGAVLILITCAIAWWSALSVQIPDADVAYIRPAAEAASGNFNSFLPLMLGSTESSSTLPYRPLFHISVLFDYLIWQRNSFGYHLTNLALLFGTSVFVSLITLEITGNRGNRLGAMPAIWAGLLFAVCPTHAEWIPRLVSRPELLCSLFYLCSWWSYLRFRLLREKSYLVTSLITFALAVFSNEAAVTLPIVVAWSELLLGSKSFATTRASSSNRMIWVAWFILLVGALITVRFALAGPQAMFPLDQNLQLILHSSMVNHKSLIVGGLIVLMLAWRSLKRAIPWQPFLLLIPLPLLVVPPVAPFCMLLSLAALPSVDIAKRKFIRIRTAIGTVLLFAHFVVWASLLRW
jgi:hypothetical protein